MSSSVSGSLSDSTADWLGEKKDDDDDATRLIVDFHESRMVHRSSIFVL
jgi:hypothetical protein